MMKKILAFLGLFIFCFSLTAYADNQLNLKADYISGDYGYSLNEDGSATIVWFNKNNSFDVALNPGVPVLYIPNMLDGHPVTKLGNAAFMYDTPREITTIVVPEGVTTIADSALRSEWLAAAYLPSSLTSLGSCAFDGVKTIVCYSPNVKIENGAFYRSEGGTFYGYPSSTLEEYCKNSQGNVFADIAGAPAIDMVAGTYLVKISVYLDDATVLSTDYAKAGDFVMVTLSEKDAASGTAIRVTERGIYKGDGSTTVAVTNYGNGVYGFIMPASSVYVDKNRSK